MTSASDAHRDSNGNETEDGAGEQNARYAAETS